MTRLRGLLLAAGRSRRFGADKLSQPMADGDTVGLQSARRLIGVLPDCVAVLRDPESPLAEGLRGLGYRIVVNANANADAGMGSSIAAGVLADGSGDPAADGWLIALADMPWIADASIAAVAQALQQGASIAAPVYQQRRGHPVGFAAHWQGALSALDGDRGAAGIIAANAAQLYPVPVNDPGVLRDVDVPADLAKDVATDC